MKPVAAANQLTHVWRQICPNDGPYPVDCRLLAEALNIKVHGEPIEDQFEAQLRIRKKKNGKQIRAIIYNENIREKGRKNFCICHEIGHNSCHAHQEEFFCSSADLNDMAPHPQNIEQEANLFAATLLMPADDFRAQLQGQRINLALLGQLAEHRYETSLTATVTRLLELSRTAHYGVAILQDNIVKRWLGSDGMRWTGFGFRKGHHLPVSGIEHDPVGQVVDSSIWLNEKNAPRWELTQCSVYMPYYDETLVLIIADRTHAAEEFEEPDPTPPILPGFGRDSSCRAD